MLADWSFLREGQGSRDVLQLILLIEREGRLAMLWRNGEKMEIKNYFHHHISVWIIDPVVNS